MKFQLPPLDVEKADPNVIGEYLRELMFDCAPGQTGCYSCFNVNPNAVRIQDREREEFHRRNVTVHWGSDEEDTEWEVKERLELGEGWRLRLEDIQVDCHWWWDGDGTLEFVLSRYSITSTSPTVWSWSPKFLFSNTDCKKNYNWTREELSI